MVGLLSACLPGTGLRRATKVPLPCAVRVIPRSRPSAELRDRQHGALPSRAARWCMSPRTLRFPTAPSAPGTTGTPAGPHGSRFPPQRKHQPDRPRLPARSLSRHTAHPRHRNTRAPRRQPRSGRPPTRTRRDTRDHCGGIESDTAGHSSHLSTTFPDRQVPLRGLGGPDANTLSRSIGCQPGVQAAPRSLHSVAVDEIQQEVGLPPKTAATCAVARQAVDDIG